MRICSIPALFFALLLIVGVAFSSCSRRPGGVLSEKKMVELVADMQLAEAYTTTQPHAPDQRSARIDLGEGVLAVHGVSHEELDSTWGWYGKNLDDYSRLLLKVDKRLSEKKREILKPVAGMAQENETGMLWPFSHNGQVSPLGTTDGWILSLSNPEIQPGDRLIWKMHLNLMHSLTGVLGVEYTDGSSSAVTSGFNGRNNLELSLPTDTGKTVRRIYGSIRLKEEISCPLFADSISLRAMPFDSLEYAHSYSIKRYGPASRKLDNPKQRPDSVNDRPNDLPELPTQESLLRPDSENEVPDSEEVPSKSAPLKMIHFSEKDLPAKNKQTRPSRPVKRPGK